ncbi:MAG: ATP-binding protein [bacterium]|nr:ATP-binding protein [bacterium]
MIKRKIILELRKHLEQPEITVIIGPRQAGKTTVMREIFQELREKQHKALWLNLDIEDDAQHLSSQSKLIRKIELELGKQKGFVFIDEIQRKEDSGVFLKGLYDMGLPYKFIVSGSGSMELKERVHESLAGRKRVFELSTVSFEEFVDYRTEYRYQHRHREFLSVDPQKMELFVEEYLQFGGYPRVILAPTLEEKLAIIQEIYQSYLERDIAFLLQVRKTHHFSQLFRLLAAQVGQMLHAAELSRTLGISLPTIQEYLWLLEKTCMIHRVTPYFRNVRKEITKSPVYYFTDLGLRNFATGVFSRELKASEKGYLFQNFVFLALYDQKSPEGRIAYWRTKQADEIDFVMEVGDRIIPCEVKYLTLKQPEIPHSMKKFFAEYSPKIGLLVNRELETTIDLDGGKLLFCRYFPSLRD